jgi:hypothetical protein
MARQTAAMVVVMLSFMMTRLRRLSAKAEPIVYGPRAVAEKHRQETLQMTYNSTDVECLSMLRMTRAPFFNLCNMFRQRGLVRETSGLSTSASGDPLRLLVGYSTKSCLLLVSLGQK